MPEEVGIIEEEEGGIVGDRCLQSCGVPQQQEDEHLVDECEIEEEFEEGLESEKKEKLRKALIWWALTVVSPLKLR